MEEIQEDDLIIVAAGSPKTGLFLNEDSLSNINHYINQNYGELFIQHIMDFQKSDKKDPLYSLLDGQEEEHFPDVHHRQLLILLSLDLQKHWR